MLKTLTYACSIKEQNKNLYTNLNVPEKVLIKVELHKDQDSEEVALKEFQKRYPKISHDHINSEIEITASLFITYILACLIACVTFGGLLTGVIAWRLIYFVFIVAVILFIVLAIFGGCSSH